ncbi:MAG TPA: dockerin type I domain-containing protein [Myxococcota bacterium]|nr:dockerin type I domain-containing protein [Myxococcota bacterium]
MRWVLGLPTIVGVATLVNAQPLAPASGGERAALLKCFFECKPGPTVQGEATFQEITTLMLTNESPNPRVADIYYFGGRQQCVAHSTLELSPVDLDELNICHSLVLGGVTPPLAGLTEILVTDPATSSPGDGVYAWGKNVLGKFRQDNPEPFEGRVIGVGKYECRLVPYEVGAQQAVVSKCQAPVQVNPIQVEATGECGCNGDLDGDGYVTAVDAAILIGCIGQPPVGPCALADINCDGAIDANDQTIFACQFAAGLPDPSCCP